MGFVLKMGRKNKAITVLSVLFLLTVVGVFVAYSVYFEYHFFPNTFVGEEDISGLRYVDAERKIRSKMDEYQLSIVLRNKSVEKITADDIGLAPLYTDPLLDSLYDQHGFEFIIHLFKKNTISEVQVSVDPEKYEKVVSSLSFLSQSNMTEPVDAHIEYADGQYVMVPEIMGDTLNPDEVRDLIKKAIITLKSEIVLENEDVYKKPNVYDTDVILNAALIEVNEYLETDVEYQSGGKTLKLNAEKVAEFIESDNNGWIKLDSEGHPILNDKRIDEFVATIKKTYDSNKNKQLFRTSYGKDVEVANKGIGFLVNADAEKEAVMTALKEHKKEAREPIYSRRALSSGKYQYGNSYIEVNLTAQHVFVYIKGIKVFETDCVTGSVRNGTTTRQGMFTIKYKQRNAVLRGVGYATPVNYWMPFDGGIGLHDATWRGRFGGQIYKTNGSHGCVNLPLSAAKNIYEFAYTGMPVIVYTLPGTEQKTDESADNN